jgi:molecular chaperone GrpE
LGKVEKEQLKQEKEQKKQAQNHGEQKAEQTQTEASEKEKNPVEAELEAVQEELDKHKELLLRTAAEYDNYRKRTEREKAGIYSDATAASVVEFLAVADNLARALEQENCSAEDLHKGVAMVNTQLLAALEKLGVKEMGKVGEAFNPDLHNAVSHIEDENAGDNTIVQVFQKGYQIGDKVVRHAMVQVAN